MITVARAFVVAGIVAVTAVRVAAQWPPYPTPGIPRLADGSPDLAASAPRTSDGRPDLSGLWQNRGIGGQNARPPEPPAGTPPLATFWNVGVGFEEGLPFQPWAAELRKKRMADDSRDNPEVDVTIDDPKAYTRPWTVRINQYIMVDTELLEMICHENQQFMKRIGSN